MGRVSHAHLTVTPKGYRLLRLLSSLTWTRPLATLTPVGRLTHTSTFRVDTQVRHTVMTALILDMCCSDLTLRSEYCTRTREFQP